MATGVHITEETLNPLCEEQIKYSSFHLVTIVMSMRDVCVKQVFL
jgi:hypothetical protein